jgi:oxygen-dependent protoporphyrinogen oxidase
VAGTPSDGQGAPRGIVAGTPSSGQGAPRVVVVGGGVTGLSTAWHLRREAARRGAALEVVVVEKDGAVGGKVRTAHVEHPLGAFIVEAGADSYLTQSKPWALELSVEMGMAERLIGTNDEARKVFVLHRDRLHPLPEGIFLIVPTRLGPFARSGLLSPAGKLRTGLDLVLPRRKDGADETLAEFVTRRLGAQILDRIAEPLLSGIYNADAGRQSVLATLPRLRQLEQDHRSLILAALALRKRATRAAPQGPGKENRSPRDGAAASGGHLPRERARRGRCAQRPRPISAAFHVRLLQERHAGARRPTGRRAR